MCANTSGLGCIHQNVIRLDDVFICVVASEVIVGNNYIEPRKSGHDITILKFGFVGEIHSDVNIIGFFILHRRQIIIKFNLIGLKEIKIGKVDDSFKILAHKVRFHEYLIAIFDKIFVLLGPFLQNNFHINICAARPVKPSDKRKIFGVTFVILHFAIVLKVIVIRHERTKVIYHFLIVLLTIFIKPNNLANFNNFD